jgi:hypothetical protein
MVLLCPSVKGLQCILDSCVCTAEIMYFIFKASKFVRLRIGTLTEIPVQPMSIDTCHMECVESINYFDCHTINSNVLSFPSNFVKQNFFAAFKCIYPVASQLEVKHLTAREPCLLILIYAFAGTEHTVEQLDELDARWNQFLEYF